MKKVGTRTPAATSGSLTITQSSVDGGIEQNPKTEEGNMQRQSSSDELVPVTIVSLENGNEKTHVSWDESVIDNENMGKKKSKSK